MPLRSRSLTCKRLVRVSLPCTVGILGLLSCFLWLERTPLYLTDESRHAVNAWEMLHGGDWFNYSFGGEPDRWNAKPQLLVWLQALGYAVLGPRELAVRWPSAVAALATGWVAWHLFRKRFGFSREATALGVAAIYTMRGIVGFHTGRTGDMDALFTLFTTATAFFLLGKGTRAGLAAGACFGLAFLSKGFAVLLLAPGFAATALLSRGWGALVRDRGLRVAACVGAMIPFAWMGAVALWGRRYSDAAYEGNSQLGTMILYDVIARFRGTMDAVPPPPNPLFLVTQLDVMMSPWGFALVAVVAPCLARAKARARFLADSAVRVGAVLVLPAALVLQASSHKLPWYVAPLLPFAILVLLAGLRILREEGGRFAGAVRPVCAILVLVAVARQGFLLARAPDDASRRLFLSHRDALRAAREVRYEAPLRQDEMPYLSWARGGVVAGVPQGDGLLLAGRALSISCAEGICVITQRRTPSE